MNSKQTLSKLDNLEGEFKWECTKCGHTWESDIEPETNANGEYVCDRCEGD